LMMAKDDRSREITTKTYRQHREIKCGLVWLIKLSRN
jgi:hypothetical protein